MADDLVLTDSEMVGFQEALLAAFSRGELETVVFTAGLSGVWERNINNNAGLGEQVIQLIQWANQHVEVWKLLRAARQHNPRNRVLERFDQIIGDRLREEEQGRSQSHQGAGAQTDGGAQEPVAGSRTLPAPPEDSFDYQLDEQPWYADPKKFPVTSEAEPSAIQTLSAAIDLVLITATEKELDAVMRLLEPYPDHETVLQVFSGPETYYLGKFGAFRTVVTMCEAGAMSQGSVIAATLQAQSLWKPRAIIMVGIAFGKGRDAQQKLGDVLVASAIISYEQQRVGEKVIYRGTIAPSNATLLNRLKNARTWRFIRPDGQQAKMCVGHILSGEKLIDDAAFKATLFEQFPNAIGGEMEGAGLGAAAGRLQLPWILVKGICDWGVGKEDNYQPLAAAAATSLVHHILSPQHALEGLNKPS